MQEAATVDLPTANVCCATISITAVAVISSNWRWKTILVASDSVTTILIDALLVFQSFESVYYCRFKSMSFTALPLLWFLFSIFYLLPLNLPHFSYLLLSSSIMFVTKTSSSRGSEFCNPLPLPTLLYLREYEAYMVVSLFTNMLSRDCPLIACPLHGLLHDIDVRTRVKSWWCCSESGMSLSRWVRSKLDCTVVFFHAENEYQKDFRTGVKCF